MSNNKVQNVALNLDAQNALTPDSVLENLMNGNQRFIEDANYSFDNHALRSQTTGGQFPKAVILSCIDSRVPVETIFDQSIGDVFVSRVAGNIVNPDILGSLEYSCKVAGSKIVMVLGHEACGAVKAACDHVELGNITHLLANITPAVDAVKTDGERSSKNNAFVADVIKENVNMTIERIRKESPILEEMEKNGEIKMVGGVYFLNSGKVELI